MKSTTRRYRVDRRQISFIKFILEAYDNLAVVSTVDAELAVLQILVAPGCERELDVLIASLAGQFTMQPL